MSSHNRQFAKVLEMFKNLANMCLVGLLDVVSQLMSYVSDDVICQLLCQHLHSPQLLSHCMPYVNGCIYNY
jgi:hypothetical protein